MKTPEEWSREIYDKCHSPIMGRATVKAAFVAEIQADARRQLETELNEANERATSAEFRLTQEKNLNSDHEQDYLAVWKLIKRPDETVVQAVQRVSGELAEAVKRMEAVDFDSWAAVPSKHAALEGLKDELISAAKGEQQLNARTSDFDESAQWTIKDMQMALQKIAVLRRERDDARSQLHRICKDGFDMQDTIGLEPADDYVLRQVAKMRADCDNAVRETEDLQACAIHSCHADCQRPSCKARRENLAMRDAINSCDSALQGCLNLILGWPFGTEGTQTATMESAHSALSKLQPFIK